MDGVRQLEDWQDRRKSLSQGIERYSETRVHTVTRCDRVYVEYRWHVIRKVNGSGGIHLIVEATSD